MSSAAIALLLLVAPPAAAERVFILPVRAGTWVHGDDRRILEERVAIALARGRRVQALGARDLPAAPRAGLPADLSACVTPECLKALGRVARAAHVLSLELLEDGAGTLLFATLFEAATGSVLHRRELPRALHPSATRAWAEEVARWIGRAREPGAEGEDQSDRFTRRRHPEPLLQIAVVAGQETRSEARALAAELTRRLDRRGRPRLALAPAETAIATHAAWIEVESVSSSHRPHFVHRHQTGTLVATLSIAETGGKAPLFTRRASARITRRIGRDVDQGMVGDLVREVTRQWVASLEDRSIDRLLTRGGKP